MMEYITSHCPLRQLSGGLLELHQVNPEAANGCFTETFNFSALHIGHTQEEEGMNGGMIVVLCNDEV